MWEEHTGSTKTKIRFLVLDVDGTLTDGKIYMGQSGELFKAFDIKDGAGIRLLLPKAGIEPVVITARKSAIVQNRCEELGIALLFQNEGDKLAALRRVLSEYNTANGTDYGLAQCAYMGDDTIDLACMRAVKAAGGIVACPADAVEGVRRIADFVCTKNGGNGAVRECIEWMLHR